MRIRPALLSLLALPLVSTGVALAQPGGAQSGAPAQNARVELLSDVSTVEPGKPFTLALRFEINPEWHLYWKNPGDAGMPPEVQWSLPPGFVAGELQFPAPREFKDKGDAQVFGYEEAFTLLVEVTPPADLRSDSPLRIEGLVKWLECKELCLPGRQNVELELTTSAEPRVESRSLQFVTWQNAIPLPATPEEVTVTLDDGAEVGTLRLAVPAGTQVVEWFPAEGSDQPYLRQVVQNTVPDLRVELGRDELAGEVEREHVVVFTAPDGTRTARSIKLPLTSNPNP